MYGIFTYTYDEKQQNVGKYAIYIHDMGIVTSWNRYLTPELTKNHRNPHVILHSPNIWTEPSSTLSTSTPETCGEPWKLEVYPSKMVGKNLVGGFNPFEKY